MKITKILLFLSIILLTFLLGCSTDSSTENDESEIVIQETPQNEDLKVRQGLFNAYENLNIQGFVKSTTSNPSRDDNSGYLSVYYDADKTAYPEIEGLSISIQPCGGYCSSFLSDIDQYKTGKMEPEYSMVDTTKIKEYDVYYFIRTTDFDNDKMSEFIAEFNQLENKMMISIKEGYSIENGTWDNEKMKDTFLKIVENAISLGY